MADSDDPVEQDIGASPLLAAERLVLSRLQAGQFDLDALHAISNIYRAAAGVRRRAEREVLADHQLSWGGFTILWVLWVWGEKETADLAAECDLAKGTLTGMLNTLERQGFVQRSRLDTDRRRVSVVLTDAGRATIEQTYPAFNDFEAKMLVGLDADDQRELARLLRVVTNNANSD
ncbi:MAG: MarR family transcriptional regulator [Acidimicrobiales bacterium]|nr:MarR family transcriptional regulator [Acidimicrobiales bacterium]